MSRDQLRRSLERCIVSLASRPRGLRGPFRVDHDYIERAAASIRARDAAKKEVDEETVKR